MQVSASDSPLRRKQPISLLRSVGLKLFLSVLGGSLIGLACTSYLSYRELTRQSKAELRSRIQVKAKDLRGDLDGFESSAQLVAEAAKTLYQAGERREAIYVDLIGRSLKSLPLGTGLGFGQPPDQRRIIPARRYAYPFAIRDRNGKVVAKGGETNPTDFEAGYFQDPIRARKPLWLEPVRYEETTVTPPRIFVSTSYSLPFYSDRKELLGVLNQDMELGYLSQKLAGSVMREQGHFLLVSARGHLIAYPPNPQLALDLKEFPQINNYDRLWLQIKDQVKMDPEDPGIVSWVDAEGKRELWAYQRIPNNNWVLLAAVPESVVVGPVLLVTAGSTLGAILGTSIVLAIVVAMFVRRLNQRLQPIMDECNRLAETSAKTEELMSREDELGRLTISFYSLLGQVTVNEKRLRKEMARAEQALQALQQTQAQLIQTEKMSSLGQLVAGVAHEINNPINFIYGNLPHARSSTQDLLRLIQLYDRKYPRPDPEIQDFKEEIDLEFLIQDLEKMLDSMSIGADRIREIVLSLRNFSRLDESDMKWVNIHEGLDSTLLILQNRLKGSHIRTPIQVVKEYGNLPMVECYAGQLNQVFMNILSNAIDALEKFAPNDNPEAIAPNPPQLTIRTEMLPGGEPTTAIQVLEGNQASLLPSRLLPPSVVIRIWDNGPGIPPEHQSKLFDPFFTTKPVGKGTGLGLSISYQIVVERHHGSLRCISEPGKGAEFRIEIPIRQ